MLGRFENGRDKIPENHYARHQKMVWWLETIPEVARNGNYRRECVAGLDMAVATTTTTTTPVVPPMETTLEAEVLTRLRYYERI